MDALAGSVRSRAGLRPRVGGCRPVPRGHHRGRLAPVPRPADAAAARAPRPPPWPRGRQRAPSVPERALSVPVLPLVDGQELRIGDSVSAVAERLGRAAESGRQEVDRGAVGERLTRFYEYSGSRFILVFEPLEQDGEARLPRSTCRRRA